MDTNNTNNTSKNTNMIMMIVGVVILVIIVVAIYMWYKKSKDDANSDETVTPTSSLTPLVGKTIPKLHINKTTNTSTSDAPVAKSSQYVYLEEDSE